MKKFIFAFYLVSSTVMAFDAGLSIKNSFQVDPHGNVFRGKEPKKAVDELRAIGITDVIIFKNEVKDEVTKEKENLTRLGINIHHIPFRWKEYPSMQEACEQMVSAINIIQEVKARNGKVFFHCTAGEDRTGALAGLYRMLSEGYSKEQVFAYEMCPRGYSDGNPHKPTIVSSAIEKELTPLFLALAYKIETKQWVAGRINPRTCQNLQVYSSALKCRR